MKTFIVWAQELIGDERGNSELEDKSIEIMKSKEQRKKKKRNKKQSLRSKTTGLTFMLQESQKVRRNNVLQQKIGEEIIAENFPNMLKDRNLKIQ